MAAAQAVHESLRAAQPAGGQTVVLIGSDLNHEISGNACGVDLSPASSEGQDQVGPGTVFIVKLAEVSGALWHQGAVIDPDHEESASVV